MYIAIIGDLVRSRDLGARDDVQKQLKVALEDISETYQDQLASSFTITLGDEFQGLLKEPQMLLRILFEIKSRIHPVKVRFGVGLGEITTEIDPLQSIGADGPAYHVARSMIGEVKREETGKHSRATDIMLGRSLKDERLTAVNAGLTLMHFMEVGWTDKQRDNIIDSLLKGLNQSEIADQRGLYQSTIHRSLVSAGFYEYEQAFRDFQLLINSIWRDLR